VLAVGPNGAGKTNLLEALHVGTQGFSPRTRSDAQLVRFEEESARISLRGARAGVELEIEVRLKPGQGKRARLNGAPLRAAELLRKEIFTLVFTPDRLAVVKGGPAARRAYFDRVLSRLLPARAFLPLEYAAALVQRNAALRRIASGHSGRDTLVPWTRRVADLGAEVVTARRETLRLLQPAFAEQAAAFGMRDAGLTYVGESPSTDELVARLSRDLERGTTGAGPHLHDVTIAVAGRDLRGFGSQGEQRLAVLSLLLAEADVLSDRGGSPPLLLLDDVLSELDPDRRAVLADRIRDRGQTLVTSTTEAALPIEPSQLVHVSPGRAEGA
jgi:DNA replication and repair protein RecF